MSSSSLLNTNFVGASLQNFLVACFDANVVEESLLVAISPFFVETEHETLGNSKLHGNFAHFSYSKTTITMELQSMSFKFSN